MDRPVHIVTGGGRGVGRAVVKRLVKSGQHVVAIEREPTAVDWIESHPDGDRIDAVAGDAADPTVLEHAVQRAYAMGTLVGWVNNAAIFRDAALHNHPLEAVAELVNANLKVALAGCVAAVRAFLAAETAGAIVNVSSHQAQRPVPGCLPYATAKAAIEGLTRAVAVDYGRLGIRANAVALGTIAVDRYVDDAESRGAEWACETDRLHALMRVGQPDEAASTITYLLSEEASFISGAVIPVDGGRSALAREPQLPEENGTSESSE
ncbi:SDR family NAD(P)-dependent oxidoreductase [Phytoactinopolyspora mesophila]|uniref:SDR family oxidoreductase n=1 Tax=Phytoactinopolyspora mesophila TaxID=2650750 RepID=A0A7K3M8B6_9ACTN|nr:SDR family oxidoreductase [Phytoactinopolyspora mesophila]NDL59514.1 SDR family oxidoreductase [Phytoactinopolyspora mesophila]